MTDIYCISCKKHKDEKHFYMQSDGSGRLYALCKMCHRALTQEVRDYNEPMAKFDDMMLTTNELRYADALVCGRLSQVNKHCCFPMYLGEPRTGDSGYKAKRSLKTRIE